MDDQFNGRTDDDLFADEFEPVDQASAGSTKTKPAAVAAAPTIEPQKKQPIDNVSVPQPAKAVEPAPQPAVVPPSKPSGLSQSRHNTQKPRPRKQSPKPKPHPAPAAPAAPAASAASAASTPSAASDPSAAPASSTPTDSPATSSAPPTAPTGPAAVVAPGSNTAGPNRHLSGQNPRTKLTHAELEEKMQAMKLQNAERTRKFEKAEQDERSHELAFKKGMEEARKRKAEEAERRKRGEEERKKLEEERERNRERKLKALGSWDQEKSFQDEPERRNFRGANGGIRGERKAGLGGSRFAERDDGAEEEGSRDREFGAGEFRGRGRGRGRGGQRGGGRGRGGFGNQDGERTAPAGKPVPESKPPKPEDFPALPPQTKSIDTAVAKEAPFLPTGLTSPLVGKWDDEMEALDAKAKEAES